MAIKKNGCQGLRPGVSGLFSLSSKARYQQSLNEQNNLEYISNLVPRIWKTDLSNLKCIRCQNVDTKILDQTNQYNQSIAHLIEMVVFSDFSNNALISGKTRILNLIAEQHRTLDFEKIANKLDAICNTEIRYNELKTDGNLEITATHYRSLQQCIMSHHNSQLPACYAQKLLLGNSVFFIKNKLTLKETQISSIEIHLIKEHHIAREKIGEMCDILEIECQKNVPSQLDNPPNQWPSSKTLFKIAFVGAVVLLIYCLRKSGQSKKLPKNIKPQKPEL